MAITAETLDRAQRVPYMRLNAAGALVFLGFDLVKVDTNEHFFEPVSFGRISSVDGSKQRGMLLAPELLKRNRAVPLEGPGSTGVFFYGGI